MPEASPPLSDPLEQSPTKPLKVTVVEGRPQRLGDFEVVVRRKRGRGRGRQYVVIVNPAASLGIANQPDGG